MTQKNRFMKHKKINWNKIKIVRVGTNKETGNVFIEYIKSKKK